MLFDGAVLLFSHDEVASGTDLAKLYVDTLNQAEADPEEIHFLRISKLYQLMPCDNVDKPVYLTTCLKWSNKDTGSPVGHPRLHQHIAYGLWQDKQYPESRQHFPCRPPQAAPAYCLWSVAGQAIPRVTSTLPPELGWCWVWAHAGGVPPGQGVQL